MKHLLATLVAVGVGLSASAAQAETLIGHSVGAKVLVGADVWSEPSNVPFGYTGVGFAGTAGGFSYGAAAYYEFRLIKFIGLEVDLAYQHGSFHRKVTYNQVLDVTETVNTNSLRLPILAKLNIPMGLGRLWLGAGPEFTLAQSSSAQVDPSNALTETTRNVKPTYGTAGFGLVIEIPVVGIEIPLEFRASKNLSQPSSLMDRIALDAATTSVSIRAESSWVYRLGAGVGLQF